VTGRAGASDRKQFFAPRFPHAVPKRSGPTKFRPTGTWLEQRDPNRVQHNPSTYHEAGAVPPATFPRRI
jgi:hypothetical protein